MINEKIIDANFLKLVSSKLKLVLNPTQWLVDDEENRLYFSLSTDLETIDDLTVLVNGVTEDESVLIFCGYISSNSITGINQGSQRIKCLGYYFEGLLLKIVVGVDNPDDSEDPSQVRRLLSEVFIPGDTKNHCTEISALEEFPTVTAYETSFAGESSDNWEFTIVGNLDTDGPSINPRSLTISPEFTYTIDKISKSQTADKLANNITFNVSGEGIESTSTTLDFDDDPTSVDLEVNVDTTDIENYIDLAVASKPISPASTTVLGGFREYGGTGSPQKSTNLCVVKMDHTNDYHYAYVDLNDIGADVHRYTDMSRATAEHEIGDIVQFIGTTDSNYTKGYFYIRTRRNISGTLASTSNWITDSSINLDEKLSTYNQSNDYLLPVPGTIVIIPNIPNTSGVISESGTIVNSTLCYLTCNTFSDTLTYEEVKALGIKLSQEAYTSGLNLSVYTASIAIVYSQTDNPPVWVQKNVLPVVRVGAPLVYRGTVTALQGETDIEALTRVVVNPEDGDFYTVLPSQLEYFWYNGEWQDGGNLFDVDIKDLRDSTGLRTIWSNKQDAITAGTGLSLASDGVTINHSNGVTAGTAAGSATKTLTFGDTFDIPTVTYDAQGHITAKGTTTMTMPANPNTDTQADWNESDTSSAAYINNKPSLATVATSGLYSDLSGTPNLATVATSGNYNDLSNKPSIPSVISADDYVTVSGSGGGSGTGIGTYVPVGTVQMYAGEESPAGWLLCDGSNILVESCTSEQRDFEYNGTYYKSSSAGLSPITKIIKNNYSNGLPHAYYVSDPGGLGEGWVKTIQRVLTPTPIVLITSITADISDAHTDYYTDQTFAKGTSGSYEIITTRQDPCIKIPDLRRKFPLGAKANDTIGINNADNRNGWSTTIGKTGGELQHVLTEKELPRTLYDNADYSQTWTDDDKTWIGNVLGSSGSAVIIKAKSDYRFAHNNTPPFLALNFIIKL